MLLPIIVLGFIFPGAFSTPTGALSSACEDMTPGHGGDSSEDPAITNLMVTPNDDGTYTSMLVCITLFAVLPVVTHPLKIS